MRLEFAVVNRRECQFEPVAQADIVIVNTFCWLGWIMAFAGRTQSVVNPSRIRDSVMKIEGAGQESIDEVLTLTPSWPKEAKGWGTPVGFHMTTVEGTCGVGGRSIHESAYKRYSSRL